jgi:hypothetical protein
MIPLKKNLFKKILFSFEDYIIQIFEEKKLKQNSKNRAKIFIFII